MKDNLFQENNRIIFNKRISKNYFKIIYISGRMTSLAKPGQFVEIKITQNREPFLRRPFGIHKVNAKNLEILYEVVGAGTEILSQRKPGEFLDVIGPLGKGFTFNMKHSILNILVAGGMGVAPLVFLAEKLAEIKKQKSTFRLRSGLMVNEVEPSKIKNLVLIGGKTKEDILCEKEFQNLGCQVTIATDDGSRGFKGKVTELFKNYITHYTLHITPKVYACGSRPMLKEISQISKKYKIPAQVSLEEHMACGIGACLGCAVNTKQGFKRVCKEGPVFNVNEILWE